jgi:ketosteroid isomerase-like protein
MSEQANAKTVIDLYQAFGRGDITAVLDLLSDDIDWWLYGSPDNGPPFAGHHIGKDAIGRFFQTVGETAEVLQFGPEADPIAAGDHVIVQGFERVTARPTGKTFETHWLHLFTFSADGKIVRLREYYDTAAMAEAYRK